MYICPKAKECKYHIGCSHAGCHTKVEDCIGNEDSNCPACVPYEPSIITMNMKVPQGQLVIYYGSRVTGNYCEVNYKPVDIKALADKITMVLDELTTKNPRILKNIIKQAIEDYLKEMK